MAPNVVTKPQWITVGAGTRRKTCDGLGLGGTCCRSIYVAPDPDHEDRFVAVDCDVPGARRPSLAKDAQRRQNDLFGFTPEVHDGRGLAHDRRTCPDWNLIVADRQRRHSTDIPQRKRA